MEIQCCKCAKARHEDGWRWTEGFTDGPVSYSYCPECLDEFRYEAGLRRRRKSRARVRRSIGLMLAEALRRNKPPLRAESAKR